MVKASKRPYLYNKPNLDPNKTKKKKLKNDCSSHGIGS